MHRAIYLRRIALAVTVAVVSLPPPPPPPEAEPQAPSAEVVNLLTLPEPPTTNHQPTAAQQELIDGARDRFRRAGLVPPAVDIYFHPDLEACHGRVGLYYSASDSLHMCRDDERTMLHELAHAWTDENLTAADQAAFAEFRGLEAWNDHDHEWADRGTEHAAETIAWALMDDNMLVPTAGPAEDGSTRTVWRLLTIDDSEPDQLVAAYVFLTGHTPAYRLDDDPRLEPFVEATSPEARGLVAAADLPTARSRTGGPAR